MRKAGDDSWTVRVAGIGVACGFGYGKDALLDGLFKAKNLVGHLTREGREPAEGDAPFLGVEMPDPPEIFPSRLTRTASLSGRVALAVLSEAWQEAGLDAVAPKRIGLVVGGTNLMSREQALAVRDYDAKLSYVPPRHAHCFLDTDICGLCTTTFPIRGFSQVVGAASASGSVAIIQARDAILTGRADVCIALGALQDLSRHDLQAMRSLGAMGSNHYAGQPEKACRPMDIDHDGFIYGEACAALVLTRESISAGNSVYAELLGTAQVADGTRGPEPNTLGQVRAAQQALAEAGLTAREIDYVNGHATGTPAGDNAELETYRTLELHHAKFNTTKSIIGHGLSAAGAIEVAAVLLQMKAHRLHPSRNLDRPQDPDFGWVGGKALSHQIRHALKFSFGFGGTETALVIRNL